MADNDSLRYPVGRFARAGQLAPARRSELVDSLAALPASLRALVEPLRETELGKLHRPGGWTVRQIAHHLPESHMNAYIRMKLALTEELPAVKTYEEALWAELPDIAATPVAVSLDLADALHRRWVGLLRSLPEAAFQRAFQHPEWGIATLDDTLGLYEWHGRHHLAHIRNALDS